jgi:hypothetical protein
MAPILALRAWRGRAITKNQMGNIMEQSVYQV